MVDTGLDGNIDSSFDNRERHNAMVRWPVNIVSKENLAARRSGCSIKKLSQQGHSYSGLFK